MMDLSAGLVGAVLDPAVLLLAAVMLGALPSGGNLFDRSSRRASTSQVRTSEGRGGRRPDPQSARLRHLTPDVGALIGRLFAPARRSEPSRRAAMIAPAARLDRAQQWQAVTARAATGLARADRVIESHVAARRQIEAASYALAQLRAELAGQFPAQPQGPAATVSTLDAAAAECGETHLARAA